MIDFCDTDNSGLITVDEAVQQIRNSISPVTASEWLPIKNALGRVLADTVYTTCDLPGSDNSAMDGYAINSRDIVESKTFRLQLTGTSWAGKPLRATIHPGCCARVFTGANLPTGTDSVIPQEQTRVLSDKVIEFPEGVQSCQYVRHAGEEFKRGDPVLEKDRILNPVDLGLLAAAGLSDVRVKRSIAIAFLSTGDELVSVGLPLDPGQIYDSNRYTLAGLLNDPAWHVTDLGSFPDDRDSLADCLNHAARTYDVIITTGGASVGEADFIKEILAESGQVNFWKIAMKPGKPLAFGKMGACYFFGLPGNPVSVLATFQHIVAPSLTWMSGVLPGEPLRFLAQADCDLKKSPGRQEFQRGILTRQSDGSYSVTSAGHQGSHILSTFSRANCYILFPAQSQGAHKGELVEVEPFATTTR